ncbi:unnamed protein product [Amoebophrya sp. A120]|nr:unnamed protein product [Amoebophrya sp. A120]|eukprot:GSA120T00005632001.1
MVSSTGATPQARALAASPTVDYKELAQAPRVASYATVKRFEISPKPPSFLTFDQNLGVLAGVIPEDLKLFDALLKSLPATTPSAGAAGIAGDQAVAKKAKFSAGKVFSQTFFLRAVSDWGTAEQKITLRIRPKRGPEVLSLVNQQGKTLQNRRYHLGCKVKISGPQLDRGTLPTEYRIDPDASQLPKGVMFDPMTGTIQGTALRPINNKSFTIFGKNKWGEARVDINISVFNPNPPVYYTGLHCDPAIQASDQPCKDIVLFSFLAGQLVYVPPPFIPSVVRPKKFRLEPSLEAIGVPFLVFDPHLGTIGGKTREDIHDVLQKTRLKIFADYGFAEVDSSIDIEILPQPPPFDLSLKQADADGQAGTLSLSGGTERFTAASATVTSSVMMSNTSRDSISVRSTSTDNITGSAFLRKIVTFSYRVDHSFVLIRPDRCSGSRPERYTLEPNSLPKGLFFDESSGCINGVPRAWLESAIEYRLCAVNQWGTAGIHFKLEIPRPPPPGSLFYLSATKPRPEDLEQAIAYGRAELDKIGALVPGTTTAIDDRSVADEEEEEILCAEIPGQTVRRPVTAEARAKTKETAVLREMAQGRLCEYEPGLLLRVVSSSTFSGPANTTREGGTPADQLALNDKTTTSKPLAGAAVASTQPLDSPIVLGSPTANFGPSNLPIVDIYWTVTAGKTFCSDSGSVVNRASTNYSVSDIYFHPLFDRDLYPNSDLRRYFSPAEQKFGGSSAFLQRLNISLDETTGEMVGLIPENPGACGHYFFKITVKSSTQDEMQSVALIKVLPAEPPNSIQYSHNMDLRVVADVTKKYTPLSPRDASKFGAVMSPGEPAPEGTLPLTDSVSEGSGSGDGGLQTERGGPTAQQQDGSPFSSGSTATSAATVANVVPQVLDEMMTETVVDRADGGFLPNTDTEFIDEPAQLLDTEDFDDQGATATPQIQNFVFSLGTRIFVPAPTVKGSAPDRYRIVSCRPYSSTASSTVVDGSDRLLSEDLYRNFLFDDELALDLKEPAQQVVNRPPATAMAKRRSPTLVNEEELLVANFIRFNFRDGCLNGFALKPFPPQRLRILCENIWGYAEASICVSVPDERIPRSLSLVSCASVEHTAPKWRVVVHPGLADVGSGSTAASIESSTFSPLRLEFPSGKLTKFLPCLDFPNRLADHADPMLDLSREEAPLLPYHYSNTPRLEPAMFSLMEPKSRKPVQNLPHGLTFDPLTGEIGGMLAIPPQSQWGELKRRQVMSGISEDGATQSLTFRWNRGEVSCPVEMVICRDVDPKISYSNSRATASLPVFVPPSRTISTDDGALSTGTTTARLRSPSEDVADVPFFRLEVGKEFSSLRPWTRNRPFRFLVNKRLPAGLQFCQLTGVLSGSPRATCAKERFSIRCDNHFGNAVCYIDIECVREVPAVLGYHRSQLMGYQKEQGNRPLAVVSHLNRLNRGLAKNPNDYTTQIHIQQGLHYDTGPLVVKGEHNYPKAFHLSGALPHGLCFDSMNGRICGLVLIQGVHVREYRYTISIGDLGICVDLSLVLSPSDTHVYSMQDSAPTPPTKQQKSSSSAGPGNRNATTSHQEAVDKSTTDNEASSTAGESGVASSSATEAPLVGGGAFVEQSTPTAATYSGTAMNALSPETPGDLSGGESSSVQTPVEASRRAISLDSPTVLTGPPPPTVLFFDQNKDAGPIVPPSFTYPQGTPSLVWRTATFKWGMDRLESTGVPDLYTKHPGAYVYTLENAHNLPAGMFLDPQTGQVGGRIPRGFSGKRTGSIKVTAISKEVIQSDSVSKAGGLEISQYKTTSTVEYEVVELLPLGKVEYGGSSSSSRNPNENGKNNLPVTSFEFQVGKEAHIAPPVIAGNNPLSMKNLFLLLDGAGSQLLESSGEGMGAWKKRNEQMIGRLSEFGLSFSSSRGSFIGTPSRPGDLRDFRVVVRNHLGQVTQSSALSIKISTEKSIARLSYLGVNAASRDSGMDPPATSRLSGVSQISTGKRKLLPPPADEKQPPVAATGPRLAISSGPAGEAPFAASSAAGQTTVASPATTNAAVSAVASAVGSDNTAQSSAGVAASRPVRIPGPLADEPADDHEFASRIPSRDNDVGLLEDFTDTHVTHPLLETRDEGIFSASKVYVFTFRVGELSSTGPIVVEGLQQGRDVLYDIDRYDTLEELCLSFDCTTGNIGGMIPLSARTARTTGARFQITASSIAFASTASHGEPDTWGSGSSARDHAARQQRIVVEKQTIDVEIKILPRPAPAPVRYPACKAIQLQQGSAIGSLMSTSAGQSQGGAVRFEYRLLVGANIFLAPLGSGLEQQRTPGSAGAALLALERSAEGYGERPDLANVEFSIQPTTLPEGLVFDGGNGVIFGIPVMTETSPRYQEYTVRAKNAFGSSEMILRLVFIEPTCSRLRLEYPIGQNLQFCVGERGQSKKPKLMMPGGRDPHSALRVVRYELMPGQKLPPGLMFDTRTAEFVSFMLHSEHGAENGPESKDFLEYTFEISGLIPTWNARGVSDWMGYGCVWDGAQQAVKRNSESGGADDTVWSTVSLSRRDIDRFYKRVVLDPVTVRVSLIEKPHNLRYASPHYAGVWLKFFTSQPPRCQGVGHRVSHSAPLQFSISPSELPFGLRFDDKSGTIYGVPGAGGPGEQIHFPSAAKQGWFGGGANTKNLLPATDENVAQLFLEGVDREYTITAANKFGKSSTKLRLTLDAIKIPKSLKFKNPHGYTTFVKVPIFNFSTGEAVSTDVPQLEERHHFFSEELQQHLETTREGIGRSNRRRIRFALSADTADNLPPGLRLDPDVGHISGYVPYLLAEKYLNRAIPLTIEARNFTKKNVDVTIEIHIKRGEKPDGLSLANAKQQNKKLQLNEAVALALPQSTYSAKREADDRFVPPLPSPLTAGGQDISAEAAVNLQLDLPPQRSPSGSASVSAGRASRSKSTAGGGSSVASSPVFGDQDRSSSGTGSKSRASKQQPRYSSIGQLAVMLRSMSDAEVMHSIIRNKVKEPPPESFLSIGGRSFHRKWILKLLQAAAAQQQQQHHGSEVRRDHAFGRSKESTGNSVAADPHLDGAVAPAGAGSEDGSVSLRTNDKNTGDLLGNSRSTVDSKAVRQTQGSLSFTKQFGYMQFRCDSYTVTPALPRGLELDEQTGCIFGAAKEPFKDTTFVVKGFHKELKPDGQPVAETAPGVTLSCAQPAPPTDLEYESARGHEKPTYWKSATTYRFPALVGSFVDTGAPVMKYRLPDVLYRHQVQQRLFVSDTDFYAEAMRRLDQESEEKENLRQLAKSERPSRARTPTNADTPTSQSRPQLDFEDFVSGGPAAAVLNTPLKGGDSAIGAPTPDSLMRLRRYQRPKILGMEMDFFDPRLYRNASGLADTQLFEQTGAHCVDASVLHDGSFFSIDKEADLNALGLSFDHRTGRIVGFLVASPALLSRVESAAGAAGNPAAASAGGAAAAAGMVALTFKVTFHAGDGNYKGNLAESGIFSGSTASKSIKNSFGECDCEVKLELYPRHVPRVLNYIRLGTHVIEKAATVSLRPHEATLRRETERAVRHAGPIRQPAREGSGASADDPPDGTCYAADQGASPDLSLETPIAPDAHVGAVEADTLCPLDPDFQMMIAAGRDPTAEGERVPLSEGETADGGATTSSPTDSLATEATSVATGTTATGRKSASAMKEMRQASLTGGRPVVPESARGSGGQDTIVETAAARALLWQDPHIDVVTLPDSSKKGDVTFNFRIGHPVKLWPPDTKLSSFHASSASSTTSSALLTYSLQPSNLPAGLVFSQQNGSILGVAKSSVAARKYTVTVNNRWGQASYSFVLNIPKGSAPPAFVYRTKVFSAFFNAPRFQFTLGSINNTGTAIFQQPYDTSGSGEIRFRLGGDEKTGNYLPSQTTASLSSNSSILAPGLFFDPYTGSIGGHLGFAEPRNHWKSKTSLTIIASNRFGESQCAVEFEIVGRSPFAKVCFREEDKERLASGQFSVGSRLLVSEPRIFNTEREATEGSRYFFYNITENKKPTLHDRSRSKEMRMLQPFVTSQLTEPGYPEYLDFDNAEYNLFHDTSLRPRFELQGSLPEGVSFDRFYGLIYGVPRRQFKKQTVTLVCSTLWGKATAKESFAIYVPQPEPPTSIAYPSITRLSPIWRVPVMQFICGQLAETGAAKVEPNVANPSGPAVLEFQLIDKGASLPKGLNFNPVTGAIGGIVPQIADRREETLAFSILAQNEMGQCSTDIEIEILPHRAVSYKLIDREITTLLRQLKSHLEQLLSVLPRSSATAASGVAVVAVSSPAVAKTDDRPAGRASASLMPTGPTHSAGALPNPALIMLEQLIGEVERLEQRTINMQSAAWPHNCANMIEALQKKQAPKIHMTTPTAISVTTSSNICPFDLIGLLYESHYWLENLWETKMLPVWSEINEALAKANASVARADGSEGQANFQEVGTLPSGLQKVISELGTQRQKWHDKFQMELEELLPQSRKILLQDLDVYAKHYLGVALAKANVTAGGAALDPPSSKEKVPRLNVQRYVQLLKDHEELRVKAEQQVRHTKLRLESTRSLLESGNDQSKLRTFHEVGAVDKITSMGMALLAMSVCPLPGAMEVWLVSSVVMLAETDHAGRHVVVEHPRTEPLAKIFQRFNTHPSLKAYDEFILDWEPSFQDEDREEKSASSSLVTSSGGAAPSSAGPASSKEIVPVRPPPAGGAPGVRETCCLIHNATSKSLVVSLLTAEEAEKASGLMQKALRRHPVGNFLDKNMKRKEKAREHFVLVAAGDMVKVPLEPEPEDSSEDDDFLSVKRKPEVVVSADKSKTAVGGGPAAEISRYVRGFFHYGTTFENKGKAIGDAALEPGQVISFVCVESTVQVVYRTIEDQKIANHLEIKNECFEHCSVKVTQDSSKFLLETGLDPGSSVSFQGRNPVSRKVFQKTVNFDASYHVLVKRGGQDGKSVEAELSDGQTLRIEGIDL